MKSPTNNLHNSIVNNINSSTFNQKCYHTIHWSFCKLCQLFHQDHPSIILILEKMNQFSWQGRGCALVTHFWQAPQLWCHVLIVYRIFDWNGIMPSPKQGWKITSSEHGVLSKKLQSVRDFKQSQSESVWCISHHSLQCLYKASITNNANSILCFSITQHLSCPNLNSQGVVYDNKLHIKTPFWHHPRQF